MMPIQLDDRVSSLADLKPAIDGCRRCPLFRNATQGVPGEGEVSAEVMLVGEQPGDQEDLQGHPFVGPAGRLLDRAMKEAALDRARTFVTNAVKHFKFQPRGKRRIHQKPDAGEIQACRWWLDQELDLVDPSLVIALGATAARALMGKVVTISKVRGQFIELQESRRLLVTIHPSYLLRLRGEADKQREYDRFVQDLARAAGELKRPAA